MNYAEAITCPWGSAFGPAEIEETSRRRGLLTMELELSHACNLRCVYCYAASGERLPDELSLAEILDAVDQASELGAKRIIVLGGGEPLAYPDLFPVLEHIKRRGPAIDLFTNATLITPEIAQELYGLGVCPVVKMNSMQPEVQDWLAGREGTFLAARRGLKFLLAAGYPGPNMPLGAQTVICRQNLKELPEMWVWLREQNIIPYFEMITLQGRAREHPELTVSSKETQQLFETLSRIDREQYGIEWEPHPAVAGLSCNRHAYSCTVTVSGDVIPCPGVDIPVGNVRNSPLADILANSHILQELREVHKHIKGECRTCDLGESCYGCRGHAYQVTGDYMATDPLCWRKSEKREP